MDLEDFDVSCIQAKQENIGCMWLNMPSALLRFFLSQGSLDETLLMCLLFFGVSFLI